VEAEGVRVQAKDVFDAVEKYDDVQVAYYRAIHAFANVIVERERYGARAGFLARFRHAAALFTDIYSVRTGHVLDEAGKNTIVELINGAAEQMFGPEAANRLLKRRIDEVLRAKGP
jgi:hypothetical protein